MVMTQFDSSEHTENADFRMGIKYHTSPWGVGLNELSVVTVISALATVVLAVATLRMASISQKEFALKIQLSFT